MKIKKNAKPVRISKRAYIEILEHENALLKEENEYLKLNVKGLTEVNNDLRAKNHDLYKVIFGNK